MTETETQTSTWGFTFHHGDRLRKAREQRDLTQAQLAEVSSVSRASIANYEAGKTMRKLQGKTLALALGVSYDWLKDGTLPTDDGPLAQLVEQRTFNPESASCPVIPMRRYAA